jgi:hypothetical protein
VCAGTLVALLGALAYTRVGADTSYLYLAAALLVIGIGLGGTIMPSMAAAFQTLSREETPRGTSVLNVIQRIAGAIGTAMLAIILQRAITANLPGVHGGIEAISKAAGNRRSTSLLADAFGTTFWVAAAITVAALVPALLLPHSRGKGTEMAGGPA